MPPILHGESNLGTLGRPPTVATSSNRPNQAAGNNIINNDDDDDERPPTNEELFSCLPSGKRRKFILVDDDRRPSRARVKVVVEDVNMDDIPDSYRMSCAVYPRTYFPVQMKSQPGRVVPGKRYFRDDGQDDEATVIGRVTVPAPSLDGDSETAVPKITRKRYKKDVMLNDLSYRLGWCQSRTFEGRMLFLQRSCTFSPSLACIACRYPACLSVHVKRTDGMAVSHHMPAKSKTLMQERKQWISTATRPASPYCPPMKPSSKTTSIHGLVSDDSWSEADGVLP